MGHRYISGYNCKGIRPTIRGARDGFVEELDTNIALVKKRLSMEKLNVEMYTSPGYQRTRISLLFIEDRISESVLHVVLKCLEHHYAEGQDSLNGM
ncbi:spore germination protein [Brevibacillus porteri]|uniref:spore germination protein n=1 Tax=Brevibacillus porteri TaxID=2126350 RepID=UPI003636114F